MAVDFARGIPVAPYCIPADAQVLNAFRVLQLRKLSGVGRKPPASLGDMSSVTRTAWRLLTEVASLRYTSLRPVEKEAPMTKLLEVALAKVQKLPEAEQDAVAAMILEELEDEQKWDAAFARSQGKLKKLAQKARADIKAGRVKNMGFDEL